MIVMICTDYFNRSAIRENHDDHENQCPIMS